MTQPLKLTRTVMAPAPTGPGAFKTWPRVVAARCCGDRRLGEQTRWLFGAWAIVLASVIGLWFRR